MNFYSLMTQGGGVSQLVAILLLGMSVASWVVILWKSWLLQRAVGDVARSTAALSDSSSSHTYWRSEASGCNRAVACSQHRRAASRSALGSAASVSPCQTTACECNP